jgi:hypothetical protein
MRTRIPQTIPLGELILTVFDEAAQYSADPRDISRLATQTISHMLGRAPRLKPTRLFHSTVS